MIPEPDNIYVVDDRATRRARRLAQALNDLEARGKAGSERYARLKQELEGLTIAPKRRSGVTISVPRM